MQRYLLEQPKELEQMATSKIGDWIAYQAEILMKPICQLFEVDQAKADAILSRHIDAIRNRLESSLPRIYHNTIANEAIRALKKTSRVLGTKTAWQIHVIKRMIETVFSKNLTSLLLLYDTYPMFQAPFCSKSHMLTGLVHLKIDFHAEETDIIDFLKNLHGLKYLEVRYCTDNILKCIVENCKLIEELSLSLSEWQSNDYACMKMLSQLKNLRRVTQESLVWLGTDGSMAIHSILLSCENIEHIDLGVQNTKMLLEVFKYIASDKESAGRQFKLISYSGKANTQEDLRLVVETCPQLQKINLTYGEDIFRNHLEPLYGLQNLRELELTGVSFYNHVRGMLQVNGNNLVHLKLSGGNDLDLNALMDISQMCPNLASLSLGINSPIEHTPLYARTLKTAPFRNLKTLKLSSAMQLTLPHTVADFDKQLFFLLSNSLNIEYIEMFCSVRLSEDNMSKLLQANSFARLKTFKILPSSMTLGKLLVDHIIENNSSCPNVILFAKYLKLQSLR